MDRGLKGTLSAGVPSSIDPNQYQLIQKLQEENERLQKAVAEENLDEIVAATTTGVYLSIANKRKGNMVDVQYNNMDMGYKEDCGVPDVREYDYDPSFDDGSAYDRHSPSNDRRSSSFNDDRRGSNYNNDRRSPLADEDRRGRRSTRFWDDREDRSDRRRSASRNLQDSRDRSPLYGGRMTYDDYVSRDYDDRYDEQYYNRRGRDNYRDDDDYNRQRYDRSRSRSSRNEGRDYGEGRHRSRSSKRPHEDYDDDYYRDYDRREGRQDYRDRDYRRDSGDRRSPDNVHPPSATIIAQNLGQTATEEKIEEFVKRGGYKAMSIAVIRNKDGEVKGYGFVEFKSIKDAEGWLSYTKRSIVIDGKTVHLNYSKPKKYEANPDLDWNCEECHELNLYARRRDVCIQCGAERKNKGHPKYDDDLKSSNPCNVLMVRGMDFKTTEEVIRATVSKLTTNPIYDVRLIMDKTTGLSRGFCFVEMGCTEHAAELLDKMDEQEGGFEIEGRRVAAGFARHGFNSTPIAATTSKNKKSPASNVASNKQRNNSLANNAITQAVANQQPVPEFPQTAASYSGQDGTQQYGADYYQQQGQAQSYQQPSAVSSYTYDPNSGYYYDSSTGLYYDANTGYYYDGNTGHFMYWDGSRYVYVNQDGTTVEQAPTVAPNPNATTAAAAVVQGPNLPANFPDTATAAAESSAKMVAEDPNKITIKKAPKEARKIAKDMERWAKKTNVQNEARKLAVIKAQQELLALEAHEEALRKKILEETLVVGVLKEKAEKKEGIRSLFVPDNDEEGSVLKFGAASKKPKAVPAAAVVAEVQEPESDDDELDESKLVDKTKKACLLCKRQFPDLDKLLKHQTMSNLHKQNLERYKKGRQSVK